MWIQDNRPSSKGSKLLFPVLKAMKINNEPHGSVMRGLPSGNLIRILPTRTWPCGGGGRAQEQGVGVHPQEGVEVPEISCHGSIYIRSMTLSVSLTMSLSLSLKLLLTHALTHALTHIPIIHPPTHSISHSFTFSLPLSLSQVCTCMRACVSLSPSFSRFRPCILSQAFCLSLSFSFTHTLAHTQSQAVSRPLTHKRTHAPNLYLHLSRSLTQISLSFFLFLSHSLSLSL